MIAGTSQITAGDFQMIAGTSQMTADTSQMIADGSQMTADGSQMTADTSQITAGTSQTIADDSQITAGASQITAGTSQMIADDSQITAGTSQTIADDSQITADGSQMIADGFQTTADTSQITADNSQMTADGRWKSPTICVIRVQKIKSALGKISLPLHSFVLQKTRMMDKKTNIKLFENRKVRSVWDAESEKWYISIVDVTGILTDSPDPRNYWKVLKNRLVNEGNEPVTNCNRLKLLAADGKGGNRRAIITEAHILFAPFFVCLTAGHVWFSRKIKNVTK